MEGTVPREFTKESDLKDICPNLAFTKNNNDLKSLTKVNIQKIIDKKYFIHKKFIVFLIFLF